VIEQPEEVRRSIDRLANAIARRCDLDAIVALARATTSRVVAPLPPAEPQGAEPQGAGPQGSVRIALAAGPAFSFSYPDNLDRLVQAGAELVPFDPRRDPRLPEGCAGLVAGGGFPEVFGAELADNRPLLDDVRANVERGLVTWAECGGLLWLARSLDDRAMAGAVRTRATMTNRLTLGYRVARAEVDNPVLAAGETARGHEFHYSHAEPAGAALTLVGRRGTTVEGFAGPSLLATYLHLHLGADPGPAERFVRACLSAAGRAAPGPSSARP